MELKVVRSWVVLELQQHTPTNPPPPHPKACSQEEVCWLTAYRSQHRLLNEYKVL